MVNTQVRWIVRVGLYGSLAAIPFELPHRQSLPVEIPTLATALFLAVTLLQPRRCYGRIPSAVVSFVAFVCVFVLAASINFLNDTGELLKDFLLLLQSVLYLWVAANLLEDEKVAKGALLTYAGACVLRAGLPVLGIGRTSTVVWTGGERFTAFGQNENNAAMILAAGLIVVLGISYARARPLIKPRWLVLPACALIGYSIIETGSRGGLLTLVVGLVTLLLLRGGSVWAHLRHAALAVVALAAIAALAYQTPVMRNRLSETAHSGAMAGREELYPRLGEMFVEKPLLGWGPKNNQYELSLREGNRFLIRRDAHNIVLETLTATGIVGTIAFCLGLWICGIAAWRARTGPETVLPIALCAALFMANMSGNWMGSKLLWFVLAYALASARRTSAMQTQVMTPAPGSMLGRVPSPV